MTVKPGANGIVVLSGKCPSEDAEPLQRYLLADPVPIVDWRTCETLHAAVFQILLVARPHMVGPPRADFLCRLAAHLPCQEKL
jgi:hypothetical protein